MKTRSWTSPKHPPETFYEVRSNQWKGVTFPVTTGEIAGNPRQSAINLAKRLGCEKAYKGHMFYVLRVTKTYKRIKWIR